MAKACNLRSIHNNHSNKTRARMWCRVTLETRFPLEHVSPLAKIESQRRQFYRPIYSIHKSWARRPGSTFRAIGLAHFSQSPLFDSNNPGMGAYYENHNFKNKIALDPFCGGGTSLVELHRLGVKTVGLDINPIALFTTKKELDPFDLILFNQTVEGLTQQIGNKLKTYFHTQCPKCHHKTADIMYTFWVRTIRCPSCHSQEDLFKYYIIGKKQRKNPATMVICPECDNLFYSLIPVKGLTSCPDCATKFVPANGNCRHKEFSCTQCQQKFRLIEVLNDFQNQWSSRQIAIEYYCSRCGSRDYKPVTSKDRRIYKRALDDFEQLKDNLHYPHEELPSGASTVNNLRNYSFQHFKDLFTPRQLLCLGLLLHAITQIADQNMKEYIAAAFSSSLEFHTVLCPYNYTMKQIVNIFNYQTFLVPTMFVENNVWGSKKGNGTFVTYLDRIRKAKIFCQAPFEVAVKDGVKERVPIPGDSINARQLTSFQQLQSSETSDTLLLHGTSEDLTKWAIPNESIDLILTDPPYLDYIQYSELGNFFYVWLKHLLPSFPFFQFNSELISSELDLGSQKTTSAYRKGLIKVFRECNRILKPEAPLVFTFHHSTSKGWDTILAALAESAFLVTAAFPIHSEFGARPVTGRDLDLIIISRKNAFTSKILPKSPPHELLATIEHNLQKNLLDWRKRPEHASWENQFARLLPSLSEYYELEKSGIFGDASKLLETIMKQLRSVEQTEKKSRS